MNLGMEYISTLIYEIDTKINILKSRAFRIKLLI